MKLQAASVPTHCEEMAEVTKIEGVLRAVDDEDVEDDDRVREWEEGLPSLADLISLSQCLISPQLASAFSITSPSPSPARSSVDVTLASRAAFSSLRHPPPPDSNSSPNCDTVSPAHCHGSHLDKPFLDPIRKCSRILSNDGFYGETVAPFDAHSRGHADAASGQEDDKSTQYGNNEHCRGNGAEFSHAKSAALCADIESYGPAIVQKYSPSKADGDGHEGRCERSVEHDGNSCTQVIACQPCTTEGSDAPTQVDALAETEEAESNPCPAENGEASVRTLKRPRLVWTPELHKRFVDAVTHLGVRTAVPKAIMQLMNVEGLTRENVASHLQKYRLYLKRMQGLSNDLPTSSDQLFASTPLLGNLPAPSRFQLGVPAHLQDVKQVPFITSPNPVSLGRGYVAGVTSGPLPSMDPYACNVWPLHRVAAQGEMGGMHQVMQHHSNSTNYSPRN